MSSTLIAIGLGLAGSAYAARALIKSAGPLGKHFEQTLKQLSSLDYKYYRGGFEQNMSKREASLILGVPQSADKKRVQAAHRKIMFLNHPDKGGSPFLATKIAQAKELMDKK